MAEPLSEQAIHDALREMPEWQYVDGKLKRSWTFAGFKEAMSFLVRVGFHAEDQQHHPEIFNVYNRVELALSTHDAGGNVTEKDLRLARTIHEFDWRLGS